MLVRGTENTGEVTVEDFRCFSMRTSLRVSYKQTFSDFFGTNSGASNFVLCLLLGSSNQARRFSPARSSLRRVKFSRRFSGGRKKKERGKKETQRRGRVLFIFVYNTLGILGEFVARLIFVSDLIIIGLASFWWTSVLHAAKWDQSPKVSPLLHK